jgi:hypothetical protein
MIYFSFRIFSIIFDGTPHIGELFGVVARFLDGEWNVHQVLLGVMHADKSMDRDQLGGLVHHLVEKTIGLSLCDVFGSMRDAASVNGAMLEGLRALLKNNANVSCFSHMMNRVGQQLYGPNLSRFMGAWSQHFGHSKNVRF